MSDCKDINKAISILKSNNIDWDRLVEEKPLLASKILTSIFEYTLSEIKLLKSKLNK